jgi:hypothetical protein
LCDFSSFSSSSIKGRTHFAKGAGSAPASLHTHPSTSVEYEQVTFTSIEQDSDKILSTQNFTHGYTNKFIIFLTQFAILFHKLTLLFYKWFNNFETMLAFIFVRRLRIRLRRCRVAVLLSERISGQRSIRGQVQFARFASSEKHRLGN